MTTSDCARFWGFGLVLGWGLRWSLGLLRGLLQTPSIVIGRD